MPAATERSNPAPLGLVAFGLTTVLLSLINAGFIDKAGEVVVVPLAIAFGGTAQWYAGLLEFRQGNTFGTVAFTSYGSFWYWWALLVLFSAIGWIDLSGATAAIAWALLLWGVFTTYMWVGTFKLNWALWGVFALLAITFYLLGFGALMDSSSLTQFGGYVGILTGLLAMYTSFAEVTNWCWNGTVLPLGGQPSKDKGSAMATPTE